jgi:hypothetical protein
MYPASLSLWAPAHAAKWQLGITHLLEAAFYANDCRSPKWQFAVEIATLHASGLTFNDVRWLFAKGYIEHAVETGHASSFGPRTFHHGKSLPFKRRSCVVLTDLGISEVQKLCRPLPYETRPTSNAWQPPISAGSEVPHWDAAGRMLWVGSTLIKRFTVPAANA